MNDLLQEYLQVLVNYPDYFRDMVAAGGGERDARNLIDLSQSSFPAEPNLGQTRAFFSLYEPEDVLPIFRGDALSSGLPMPCREWRKKIEMPGDLIVPNPLCEQLRLASYPYIVIRFGVPLKTQSAFWYGLLTKSPIAPMVAAIVDSGDDSLQGLLRVSCATLDEWRVARAQLRGFFGSADPAGLEDPKLAFPLPGVRRFSNGRFQQLLYLHSDAPCPLCTRARETPPHKPTDAQTGNHAPEALERATEPYLGVLRDSAPMPPTMPQGNEDFDELLAAFEVLDTLSAAQ